MYSRVFRKNKRRIRYIFGEASINFKNYYEGLNKESKNYYEEILKQKNYSYFINNLEKACTNPNYSCYAHTEYMLEYYYYINGITNIKQNIFYILLRYVQYVQEKNG